MPGAENGRTVIEQGYLALDENAEVRLRRAGADLLLTAKVGRGEVREEVEVPVEPRAFEALWPLPARRRAPPLQGPPLRPVAGRPARRGRCLRRRAGLAADGRGRVRLARGG